MVARVKIQVSIALRDFAAFEDLADELGVTLEVVAMLGADGEVLHDSGAAPPAAPSLATMRKKRVQVTTALVKEVLAFPPNVSHKAIHDTLMQERGNAPSASTICRIRNDPAAYGVEPE